MLILFANKRDFTLINIVRKDEHVAMLQGMGARYVLNSESPDFITQLHSLSSTLGAKLAFDAISGKSAETVLKQMPHGSELWSYGGLSGEPLQIDPMVLIYERKIVRGFWGPPTMYDLGQQAFQQAMLEIQNNIDSTFMTHVQATYPLDQFEAALHNYHTNMSKGKVLFTMGDE